MLIPGKRKINTPLYIGLIVVYLIFFVVSLYVITDQNRAFLFDVDQKILLKKLKGLTSNAKCFFVRKQNLDRSTQYVEGDPFQKFPGFSDKSDTVFVFLQAGINRADLQNVLDKLGDFGSVPVGTFFVGSDIEPVIQVSVPQCFSQKEFSETLRNLSLTGVQYVDICSTGWCEGVANDM